ncbi:MAG: hypothetical protein Q4A01_09910, partial [Coriobacteriales bacterium]|nr:hypothetical protein [Coriobacteriales bacterium]
GRESRADECSCQSRSNIEIRIDLCWPQALFGLEYQGDKHGNQLGQDYARWFAAREEGYELWFVAKEQLESAVQMMQIGREVAKRIGCNVDMGLWPTEGELQDLLDTLAGRKHPKPVSYSERRRRRTKKQRWRRAYARSRTHVHTSAHSILV